MELDSRFLCSAKIAMTSSTSSTLAPRFFCDSRTTSGLPPLSACTDHQSQLLFVGRSIIKQQLTMNEVDHDRILALVVVDAELPVMIS